MIRKDETTTDLFDSSEKKEPSALNPHAPLAVRMRPRSLDEIVGQEHLVGEGQLLRRTIQSDRLTSVILYGPSGTGKTSLGQVISITTQSQFVYLNAVESSVAELRQAAQNARKLLALRKIKTLLFVDEIHHFNRSQQDVLMRDVEDGNLILIGATTQNPSFVINGPLLSRALVCELKPLSDSDIKTLLLRALADKERGLGQSHVRLQDDALNHLIRHSNGDARRALNALEIGVLTTRATEKGEVIFDKKAAESSCQKKIVYHDKAGDYHYDVASAFIKSMRGSDPDAALYWLAKMIHAGEEPKFIIRRILILASEDIGNADPQALILASSGLQAIEFVGMPEARIILAQLVTYMALAPKSNASYTAIESALHHVENQKVQEVPEHLRDAHYASAKKMGHGAGYQYPHDYAGHFISQEYMPQPIPFYNPTDQGFEKILKQRLADLRSKQPDSSPKP